MANQPIQSRDPDADCEDGDCIACPVNTYKVNAGYDARLLVVPAADNAIRLLPPLNITDAEIDEAMARLDAACVAVEAAQREAAG